MIVFFFIDIYLINKLLYNLYLFFKIKKYINIILINENYILSLNKKFCNKNISTSILSFNYFYILKLKLIGEIVICPKVIINKSINKNINCLYYFLYIIIHGFLHLIGFNHVRFLDYKKMKFFELFFLNYSF